MYFHVVYRQGDKGTSWYAVLIGTLDVHVSKTGMVEVLKLIIIYNEPNCSFVSVFVI